MNIEFKKQINHELMHQLELLADFHPVEDLAGKPCICLRKWTRGRPRKAEMPQYQNALIGVGVFSQRRDIMEKAGAISVTFHVGRDGGIAFVTWS